MPGGLGALHQADVRETSPRREAKGRHGGGASLQEGLGVVDVGHLNGCLRQELRAPCAHGGHGGPGRGGGRSHETDVEGDKLGSRMGRECRTCVEGEWGRPTNERRCGVAGLLAVVPAKHPARVKDDVQSNSTFLFAMTESNSQMRWGVGPRQHRDTAMRTTYWQGWWI